METPLKLRKILINTCYGGFGFSKQFLETYELKAAERGVESLLNTDKYTWDTIKVRSDPLILEVFEELGSQASSDAFAKLKTKEILESDLEFVKIEEYDGKESIQIDPGAFYQTTLMAFLAEHKNDTLVDITELRNKVAQKEAEHKAYMNQVYGIGSQFKNAL